MPLTTRRIDHSRAHLESLRTFRDGRPVPAEAEVEIAKLVDFMYDAEEEEEPKQADCEAAGASGRLKEDVVELTPEAESKNGQADEPESEE